MNPVSPINQGHPRSCGSLFYSSFPLLDANWARTVSRWYRLGSQPNANTSDEAPIVPDNLVMALLIDGLHPLTIIEAQKCIAGIRHRLHAVCGDVAGRC